jgi:membrane protein YqaA with SNARE-associated domain
MTNSVWLWTDKFFDQYGIWVVFAVAISPILQQPAVVLAALANVPVFEVMLAIFIGRSIKFMIMGYVASHAPHYLGKLWGLDRELKEAGIELSRK